MQKIMFVTVLLLCLESVKAQTTVKGRVVDDKQTPVAAATVLILAIKDSSLIKGQATNTEGVYELTNVPSGSHILMVEMLGYEVFYKRVEILLKQKIVEPGVITLMPGANTQSEVVVTGRRRLFENQIDRTVFNVQNSPASAGLTVLEVLTRSPNIDIDKPNNQIIMNGKQGVVVMLNGKPTRMEQSALLQYLGGLTAANIKKIEFIHTPPASMEAAGNAGIINIETIRKEDEGFNGSWSVNIGYGEKGKYGGSFNLNFNKGNLNLFSDFSFNSDYTQNDLRNETISVASNIVTTTSLFSKRPPFTGLQNGRLGLDYQLSKKTSVGVLLSGYMSQWKLDAQTETVTSNDTGYYSLSKLNSLENNNWKHLMGNINFQHAFSDRSKLTADFDYLYYFDNNPTDYRDAAYTINNVPTGTSSFRSRKETPIDVKVGNIDYSKSVSEKMKIQVGLKRTESDFTNDVGVEHFVNNAWKHDSVFTDILNLKENIHAAYLSVDYQATGKSFLRLGARYEKTNSNLTGTGNKNILQLNYGRLFPVISFSYRFTENTQWQLSYNERITRPSFNTIAPAFFFFSPNTILEGNPAVRPAINRQLTASYQRKNILLTVQLNAEDRTIAFIPRVDTVRNFVSIRAENLKSTKTAMISVNYTAGRKWWTSQYNIAFYGQQLQPIVNENVLTRKDFYFTFNTTQSVKLPGSFNIEITNQTSSARKYGLSQSPFNTSFNLGVQKSFNKKNKLALSWTDIFDTGSFLKAKTDQPQINVRNNFDYEFEGSILKLNFIHQFGNDKVKKSADRKLASEEELKRVN